MSRFTIVSVIFLLILMSPASAAEDWLTYYEKSGYLQTPRYDETVAYCERLAEYSPILEFRHFGISPQGRRIPLLIIDKDSEFDPAGEKTQGKAVVLFQAGIHPGEIEGKDAGLTFIRDVVINGKFSDLFDNVVVLFIPIFSVDGHERFGPYNRANQNGPKEMGWRTTAQNLNLNRDWLKADAPEMRFWIELFNRWLPDFLVDIHTTNGADYQYVITYGIESNTNVVAPLADWTTERFLPEIKGRMAESGFPFVPYIVPRHDHDVTSGLISWTASPRYSNGYGAAQNRPFLLVETHMLKPYKERVDATYQLIRHIVAYINDNATEYTDLIDRGDRLTAETMVGEYMPLRFRPSFEESTMIEFFGVDFSFEQSEISGDEFVVWGNKKVTYEVPFFHKNNPVDSALIPFAYLIPQEWQNQLNILQLHGVEVSYLLEPVELEVESYRFENPTWESKPFEGRHNLKVEIVPLRETRQYPAGTAVVFLNQRTNRIIAHLLEPKGPDSFVSWGFFDAIFERKEYIENYVAEKLARDMIEQDPDLEREFATRLESDTALANSPRARLHFFYERSPYYDQKVNVYPIGKLMEKRALPVN